MPLWMGAALLLVAAVAYLPSLSAGLVSDDFFFTQHPWSLNLLELLGSRWEHVLGRATAYRPVTVFSYALNQASWSSATGFHALNIAAHGLASVFCALLARRLGVPTPGAAIAGVLFALHPVHHEAVSWIAGRTAVLSGAFAIASMWAMCRWAEGSVHVVGATTLAVLAVLSYEGALLLPLALLAVASCQRPRGATWTQVAHAVLPVLLAWAAYFAIRWIHFSSPADDTWALSNAVTAEGFAEPVLQRATDNLWGLSVRMLGAGVGLPPLSSRTFLVTACMTLACVTAVIRSTRWRWQLPLCFVTGAFAFAPFATYTGYADRFAYLPSVALCLLLGSGCSLLLTSGRTTRLITACGVLAMSGLWARQLVVTQADWVHAGHVAEAIRQQARMLVPAPPDGAHLHVSGVPMGYGAAYVYITYFDLAMAQAYGRNDLSFAMSPGADAPCQVSPTPQKPTICLRWDSSKGTMSVVSGS